MSEERIQLKINGLPVEVAQGTSVAAAILNSGRTSFRQSVNEESRGPVCGMGICFECRVSVNGHPHIRACMTTCEPGMEVVTLG